jgi:septum site-determining protein MinC
MVEKRHEFGQVRVRGTGDGLVLQLPVGLPLPALLSQVRTSLEGHHAFFRDAELVIDYGEREPSLEELVALQQLLSDLGVRLRAVTSSRAEHRERLRSWGFHPLRLVGRQAGPSPVLPVPPPSSSSAEGAQPAQYLRRTLRSGMSVTSEGDLVIVGDVNPGAEVYAAGDVLVWGALRGTVHAGMHGNHQAMIAALRLMPTQLRIGSLVARAPDSRQALVDKPAVARVLDGAIVVEPWKSDRRA